MRLFRCMAGAALVWSLSALALVPALAQDRQTGPTPRPPDRNPCALFTEGADYVTWTVVKQLEGGEVNLRIPRAYVGFAPPPFKRIVDRAALFRLDVGSFAPISDREASRQAKARASTWMLLLVSDTRPLDFVAVVNAEYYHEDISAPLSEYERHPGPYGLLEIHSRGEKVIPRYETHTYLDEKDADVNAVIHCNAIGTVLNPMCDHFFRAGELDIELSYDLAELPNWRALQNDVARFLTCATNGAMPAAAPSAD